MHHNDKQCENNYVMSNDDDEEEEEEDYVYIVANGRYADRSFERVFA